MHQALSRSAKENFYIGSLPGIVDGRELRRYLQQFGEVASLEVIKDAATGKCKGYAFLCIDLYISEESFLTMNHIYDGRFIFVRPKLQGSDLKAHKEDFRHKRLYVSTASKRLRDQDLGRYFAQFGEVELAYFVKNHNKAQDKITFGYVNFKDCNSVDRVMAQQKHLINNQEVKCDLFKPKKHKDGKTGQSSRQGRQAPNNKMKSKTQDAGSRGDGRVLCRENTKESGLAFDDKPSLRFASTNDRYFSEFLSMSRLIQDRHYDGNIRLNLRVPVARQTLETDEHL